MNCYDLGLILLLLCLLWRPCRLRQTQIYDLSLPPTSNPISSFQRRLRSSSTTTTLSVATPSSPYHGMTPPPLPIRKEKRKGELERERDLNLLLERERESFRDFHLGKQNTNSHTWTVMIWDLFCCCCACYEGHVDWGKPKFTISLFPLPPTQSAPSNANWGPVRQLQLCLWLLLHLLIMGWLHHHYQ